MLASADIAVYDENDQVSLLVQVKAEPKTSADWAINVRRELLEEAGFTPRCFLVVARDYAYFWTSAKPPESSPDQIVASDDVFETYLNDISSNAQSISPSSLELMVGIWLNDLAQRGKKDIRVNAMAASDFSAAVANGRVEFLAAA